MNSLSSKNTRSIILSVGLLAATIVACRSEIEQTPPTPIVNSITSDERSLKVGVVNHPGQLLASNCFQCHGTNGTGLEHLAGKSANEIVNELREMSAKNPRAEIMNVHAKAYTTDEMKLIGDFFSKQ
ncbi:cytochrome c class I [Emticicia oligotrophica DSM 17448]|uniref:Cytochrome c class I n=1 Tax=Emticicia oligotrophica (strain DSM 17448 / CIP 109782 / MTCC 6937 / GPTSA100-15) TaxID=929562 RepID=A0ABM5MXV5_EMTOG|nr:cytochrome c class I [Emticicia oligotrophica]AFK01976.1 cytochrome c class I [Emticicia oligotrophica DSM 17448]